MTIEARKLMVINKILSLKDESTLNNVEDCLGIETVGEVFFDDLQNFFAPVNSKFDLDEIIEQQGYKPIDKTEFDQLVKKLDIQEPAEELLAMLTK
jgi:hypothetical protein